MNEPQDEISLSPVEVKLSPEEGEKSPFCCAKLRMWLFLIVFVSALSGGYYLNRIYPDVLGLFGGEAATSELPADLVRKLEIMDKRLQQMEEKERVALKAAEEDGTIPSSKIVPDAQDLVRLKEGLATLSGALDVIKTEIKKATQFTESERSNAQAGMASIMAFIQLQRVALSGLPFEVERQRMRKTVGQDEAMIALLDKLEPYASQGVTSLQALHKEWLGLYAPAKNALRENDAQTWLDRLRAAFEGLVSIKSLKAPEDETEALRAIAVALEQGKLPLALEKVAALPSAVQGVVQPWHTKAQARAEVDTLLAGITDRFIERGMISEPVPAKDEAKP